MSLSLVLLLALAPEPCAPSDLACMAREKTREARQTTDPQERAHALLTAARAHLALYRKTGDAAELCAARRLVPHRHTDDLGDLPRATRAEIDAELTRLQHHCASPRPTPPATEPPPPTASPHDADADADALLAVASRPNEPIRPIAAEEPSKPPTPPIPRTTPPPNPPPTDTVQPSSAHPGRGLLIAGGLSLAAASALAGSTAYAALRVERAMTAHDGLAVTANDQGYTPPDVGVTRRDLEAEAQHWRRVMLGTSVATGVVTGVAAALITAGLVKRRRTQRLALQPVLPGLLLTARF